jgi:hypothetical protein
LAASYRTIEEHEQNKYHEDAENMLVLAYRNALSGYIKTSPDEAGVLLDGMINSDQDTIVRIALNAARGVTAYVEVLQKRLVKKSFLRFNLIAIGSDGQRAAKATVDLYVKAGNDRVWEWFKEVQGQ